MLTITHQDHKFLETSSHFCQEIDRIASILDIDEATVQAYKTQSRLLDRILEKMNIYNDALQTFVNDKIESMKLTFRNIVRLCKSSRNYNRALGHELGLE